MNLSNTTPAAPAGKLNISWQTDGNGNVSGYAPLVTDTVTVDGNPVANSSQGGAIYKLGEQVLSVSAPSVTFSNLPQTYRNLLIRVTGRSSTGTPDLLIYFNGDTGANYDTEGVYNNGASGALTSAAYATSNSNIGSVAMSTAPAGQSGSCSIVVYNYADTTWFKNATSQAHRKDQASLGAYTILSGLTWRNTAAINSVTLSAASGSNFVAGSVFSLYGEA